MKKFIIYIVIATSLKRTNMLIQKALTSVYAQKNINPLNIKIIIVDDNEDKKEIDIIRNRVQALRREFNFYTQNIFATQIVKNQRTRFYSGTGAWNTAINIVTTTQRNNSYIAILDDDDFYHLEYLSMLCKKLQEEPDLIAIFSPITWIFPNYQEKFELKLKDFTERNFFIKNPGVQGSNMFFRSDILKNINGFDENLMSATDRDLMIRFIDYAQKNSMFSKICILDDSYVFYNATNESSITNNKEKKHLGLDRFYQKYASQFSKSDLDLSLQRAKKLFDYEYK